jgi:DNA-binding transcriptional regulator YhcF (GntR family)
MLPSVRQLSASLSINMHTVNKAYAKLSDEGFLTIRKGKGAIVNSSEKYAAREREIKSLKESLSVISAEAKCRSIDRGEFIKMCEESFAQFEKESKK